MPVRILQHGFAPVLDSYGLETGTWNDMPIHAQFLIDLEFLMRYPPPTGASCFYCKSPPYLKEIASYFPWIHFYAYQHQEKLDETAAEYDPAQPQLVSAVPPSITVQDNMTTAVYEFTKDIAMRLSLNQSTANRAMICHGIGSTRQLCLHAILRPSYSLMDIEGLVHPDYMEGELVLPMFIPNNRMFVSLVVSQTAGCRLYNQAVYKDEIGLPHPASTFGWLACLPACLPAHFGTHLTIGSRAAGFFQGVIRVSDAYDRTSKEIIATEYSRNTHKLHDCPEHILRMGLLSTVDILELRAQFASA